MFPVLWAWQDAGPVRKVPRKASMTLKTYRARTMGDALAEVKKDLGKDAVILHTRTYRVGGWLGLGGKAMVEITASDGVNCPPSRARKHQGADEQPASRPIAHAA